MRHFDEYGYEIWPSTITHIIITPDPSLPDARTLAGGVDIDLDDGGAGGDLTINRAGNVVLLFSADGTALAEYALTDGGLTAALAAMSSGDVVKLPPCSISGAHTVPAGGTLEGCGEASILTGALTLGAGARAQNLQVLLDEDDAGEVVGVTTSGSGDPALLRDCRIDVTNATGDAAAVKPGTVELHVRNCDTRAVSGGGDSYHYAAGGANLYVEGGTTLDVILSTAPVREV